MKDQNSLSILPPHVIEYRRTLNWEMRSWMGFQPLEFWQRQMLIEVMKAKCSGMGELFPRAKGLLNLLENCPLHGHLQLKINDPESVIVLPKRKCLICEETTTDPSEFRENYHFRDLLEDLDQKLQDL